MDIRDASSTAAWLDAVSVLATFVMPPVEDALVPLADGSLCEGLTTLAGELGFPEASVRRLQEIMAGMAGKVSSYEDLRKDYTRLFVNPRHSLIPIYEAQFLAKTEGKAERPLLAVNRTATELDETYCARGYKPDSNKVVSSDHMGAELSFLAILLGDVLDAFERGGAMDEECRIEAERFVGTHVGVWAPGFFGQMADKAQTPEYALIGTFGFTLFSPCD